MKHEKHTGCKEEPYALLLSDFPPPGLSPIYLALMSILSVSKGVI